MGCLKRGTNRWRRVIAGCGALTSLVALAAIGREGQPGLVSLWLLFAGLALAALSLHAMRKERAALEALDESEAERERAVQGRRAAEARSHELAETSPDIVTRHDRDGTITAISPACRDVLGYEPEELIGRPCDELVLVEDLPVLLAMRNRAREVDDVSATFRLVRRDGSPVWVEAKLRIVRDGDGALIEAHAILRDVHERIDAQRALAEAEERFRTAFEEGAAGMAIVSTEGRILRVNRALCTVTGHQHTELEGRTMLSLLHPDDREQHDRGDPADAGRPHHHRARRAPLPARRRPRGVGRRLDHAGPGRRQQARCTSSPRPRTSPSAAATRPSCATWPTTTRSPACSTAARSSASSSATSTTSPATARAAPPCCSTSTASRTSTTRSATAPATS